jgi:hypothetical protein
MKNSFLNSPESEYAHYFDENHGIFESYESSIHSKGDFSKKEKNANGATITHNANQV